MPRLEYFRIESLAGRADPIEAKLYPDVNIVFGLNGTGKTTLLKILASSLALDASTISSSPFTRAEVHIHSHAEKVTFTQSIEKAIAMRRRSTESSLVDEQTPYVALGHDEPSVTRVPRPLYWKPSPSHSKKRWFHTFLETSRLLPRSAYDLRSGPQEVIGAELDLMFERTIEREWLNYWGHLQSDLRTAQEKGLRSIVGEMMKSKRDKGRHQTQNVKHAYDRIESFLRRNDPDSKSLNRTEFETRLSTDALFAALIAHVETVEDTLRTKLQPANTLQSLLTAMFANKRTDLAATRIRILAGDEDLRISQLSAGEKHLLRILVTVMMYRDQSCILIDEPELSLHIDWQRVLVRAMKEIAPTSQLIIATHSPEIMAEVDDNRIVQI